MRNSEIIDKYMQVQKKFVEYVKTETQGTNQVSGVSVISGKNMLTGKFVTAKSYENS